MKSAVNIRRLAPGEADLARCTIVAVKPAEERGAQPPSDAHLARLLGDAANIIIVAVEGEIPAGYLIAYRLPRVDRDAEMVLLYEVAVAEAYRRCGLAAAMIAAMKRACDPDPIMKYWVLASRTNHAAMRLYAATGGIRSTDTSIVLYEYPGNAKASGADGAAND